MLVHDRLENTPIFGPSTAMWRMTPFAAGLAPFIDMGKDAFIGRNALLDADQRPRLFGLTCLTANPGRGSMVLDGDDLSEH